MNWLRAVMRRLDPWAAIVLGGLLAMGVVILLATPGPWQKVVHTQPPVRLEAPAPDDVAVFVMGGRGGSCTGILWLHLDAASNGLAAVVVAPRISGFSPTDGYAPVAAIADSAGPGAAAAALGGALGVSMDAWVALDRAASDLAIQAMFPMNDVRPARTRYREARTAWRGRGGDEKAWATQFESLSAALPQVAFDELGVVAFSNYVLGFGFVRSDLTLQGATSLAEALKEVDPGQVVVRAAPVIVERSLGGEVWHADTSLVEPLRQSLELGIRPPEPAKLVTVRTRAPRVLVIAPLPRPAATRYAAEVRRRLARSAGAAVDVTLVWGADERLAFRAARELDRRPALAALVAPATPSDAATAAVAKVCEMLRNRRQEAVVSGPLPAARRQRRGDARGGRLGRQGRARGRRRPPGACRSRGSRPRQRAQRAAGDRPPCSGRRRARQRPDARPGVLAGRARARPQLDAPPVRLRGRAAHRRRRRQLIRRRGRERAGAAAALGLPRQPADGGGRRGRRAGRPNDDRLPAGLAGCRTRRSRATSGCREEVSSRLATARARSWSRPAGDAPGSAAPGAGSPARRPPSGRLLRSCRRRPRIAGTSPRRRRRPTRRVGRRRRELLRGPVRRECVGAARRRR